MAGKVGMTGKEGMVVTTVVVELVWLVLLCGNDNDK